MFAVHYSDGQNDILMLSIKTIDSADSKIEVCNGTVSAGITYRIHDSIPVNKRSTLLQASLAHKS